MVFCPVNTRISVVYLDVVYDDYASYYATTPRTTPP